MTALRPLHLAFLLMPALCVAADGTWTRVSDGPYFNSLSWKPDVARGAGATAEFRPTGGMRSFNILLNENLVIGRMMFASNSGITFSSDKGARTLTFDNGDANSLISIPCERVSVHFEVPVVLANNTTLTISKTLNNSNLNQTRFTQPITGDGNLSTIMSTAALRSIYSNNVCFAAALKMSGGLTVNGSPAQTKRPEHVILSVANTYPGGTQVFSGKLVARAPGSLGTGDLVVGAYGALFLDVSGATSPRAALALFSGSHAGKPAFANIDLGASPSVTNTVSSLHVNGQKQPAGFYSVANPKELKDYLSGNGVLQVGE